MILAIITRELTAGKLDCTTAKLVASPEADDSGIFEFIEESVSLKRCSAPKNLPLSFNPAIDHIYKDWREHFITKYLERDANALLIASIVSNNLEISERAIKMGAGIDHRTLDGTPVFFLATVCEAVEMFDRLAWMDPDVYYEIPETKDNFL